MKSRTGSVDLCVGTGDHFSQLSTKETGDLGVSTKFPVVASISYFILIIQIFVFVHLICTRSPECGKFSGCMYIKLNVLLFILSLKCVWLSYMQCYKDRPKSNT